MKYDLEGGSLSSGLDSRATETACFDGFLFGCLRKRLSIDCRDFSFSSWCPLVEKAQQTAVAQTPCFRFQIWQPQVEKSDANAICIMYSRFPNQACARISCLFLPTRDFHLGQKMSNYLFLHKLLVSTKPSEIDMKNDVSHPSLLGFVQCMGDQQWSKLKFNGHEPL